MSSEYKIAFSEYGGTASNVEGDHADHALLESLKNEIQDTGKWDDSTVKLLLDEYFIRKDKFRDPKIVEKSLWCEIAKEFEKSNKRITYIDISEEFSKMKALYFKIKNNNAKATSGKGLISWQWFTKMEEIFHNDLSKVKTSMAMENDEPINLLTPSTSQIKMKNLQAKRRHEPDNEHEDRKKICSKLKAGYQQPLLPDSAEKQQCQKEQISPKLKNEAQSSDAADRRVFYKSENECDSLLKPKLEPKDDYEPDGGIVKVEMEGAADAAHKLKVEYELKIEYDPKVEYESDADQEFNASIGNALHEPGYFGNMMGLNPPLLPTQNQSNDRVLPDIKPHDYYQFNWKKNKGVFTTKRDNFTGLSGPTFDAKSKTPVDIFYKVIDADFIDRLVIETNRYAEQEINRMKAAKKLTERSRAYRWSETDRDEMIAYLALLILQGLFPLPVEQEYFSFNGFGTMPYFARIMSYSRFCLLKKMYHFVNDETLTDKTKLRKIRPVLDYFNDKFSTLYLPAREISIEESPLKWNDMGFSQKKTNKALQGGTKMYELCECRSGYLWKFYMKTTLDLRRNLKNGTNVSAQRGTAGRGRNFEQPTETKSKIAYDLIEPLLDRGHTVIIDNICNSPLLLRSLKTRRTDCFGPLRMNREFVPDSIKNLTKDELRRGEVVAIYCFDLSLIVWRSINLVYMISTYHDLQSGIPDKKHQRTFKPEIVLDYDKYRDGVKKKEQYLSAQHFERHNDKGWYKKVFNKLLNIAVFNAYVIFSLHNPNVTQRQFRTTLAEDLLKIHRRIDLKTEPRLYMSTKAQEMLIQTRNQLPAEHDHFPGRSHLKRARCFWCIRKKNSSRTTWKCIQCNVSLCIDPCFREYHKTDKCFS